MIPRIERFRSWCRLLQLSLWIVAGRRFWLAPLLVLVWPATQLVFVLTGIRQSSFDAVHAQNALIGFPLIVLGIGLGVRIIAGEIDRRTLEIAYTVPGGAQRVWLTKLIASFGLLLVSEVALAVVTFFFITGFAAAALYGALQAATFYMVLAMALAAWFKSEASGALGTALVLIVNGLLSGFGAVQLRASPLWNPLVLEQRDADAAVLLASAVQNRIGVLLAIAALIWLAIGRAERREALLG